MKAAPRAPTRGRGMKVKNGEKRCIGLSGARFLRFVRCGKAGMMQ
jgi:hypothetical protein